MIFFCHVDLNFFFKYIYSYEIRMRSEETVWAFPLGQPALKTEERKKGFILIRNFSLKASVSTLFIQLNCKKKKGWFHTFSDF